MEILTQKQITLLKKKNRQALKAYYRFSKTGRIGIEIPTTNFTAEDTLICCDIKLRPPKIPKKSKKIYKDVFIRSMKPFYSLYDVETGLYIVSILQTVDVYKWIDSNENNIKERICSVKKY